MKIANDEQRVVNIYDYRLVIDAARKFNHRSFLYMIQAASGDIKIGRTTDIVSRVRSHLAHGLHNECRISIVPVKGDLSCAETMCIRLAKQAATHHVADEVFRGLSAVTVKSILRHCARANRKISYESNRMMMRGIEDAKLFMLGGKPVSSKEIARVKGQSDELIPVEAALVSHDMSQTSYEIVATALGERRGRLFLQLSIRNAVLIGRGLDYQQRKAIIEQYAIDLRAPRIAQENAE